MPASLKKGLAPRYSLFVLEHPQSAVAESIRSLRASLIGSRTDSRGGFGFSEPLMLADSQGEDLHKPSTTPAADTVEVKTSWTPSSTNSMKSLKRPEE
jgi:hypothetical protein